MSIRLSLAFNGLFQDKLLLVYARQLFSSPIEALCVELKFSLRLFLVWFSCRVQKKLYSSRVSPFIVWKHFKNEAKHKEGMI
jgi:hypothetical protein